MSPTFTVPWTRNQPTSSPATEPAAPSSSNEAAVARPPNRIHGVRRPQRLRVRSESNPTTGGTASDAIALTPVTRASAEGAPSPATSRTWLGNSTDKTPPMAA